MDSRISLVAQAFRPATRAALKGCATLLLFATVTPAANRPDRPPPAPRCFSALRVVPQRRRTRAVAGDRGVRARIGRRTNCTNDPRRRGRNTNAAVPVAVRRRNPSARRLHPQSVARRDPPIPAPNPAPDPGPDPGTGAGADVRAPPGRRQRAAQLADLLGRLPGHALFPPESDHRGQRPPAAGGVGAPAAGQLGARGDAARHRRRHVHERSAGDGRRARRCHGTADLALSAAAEGPQPQRDQPVQPRRRGARRPDLRRHAGRGAPGARRADRCAALGSAGRRSDAGLQHHQPAAAGEGQDHRRHRRRRVRDSRLHRRLRSGDRRAPVALRDDSRSGRIRTRHLGRRFLEAGLRRDLAARLVRPRPRSRVLGRSAIRVRSTTAPCVKATTCSAVRCSRSIRRPAPASGTTSSRRTTRTTGTRTRT